MDSYNSTIIYEKWLHLCMTRKHTRIRTGLQTRDWHVNTQLTNKYIQTWCVRATVHIRMLLHLKGALMQEGELSNWCLFGELSLQRGVSRVWLSLPFFLCHSFLCGNASPIWWRHERIFKWNFRSVLFLPWLHTDAKHIKLFWPHSALSKHSLGCGASTTLLKTANSGWMSDSDRQLALCGSRDNWQVLL